MWYALSFDENDCHYQEINHQLKQIAWPCPKCLGKIILKSCCHGVFLACSNSPECQSRMILDTAGLIAIIDNVMNLLNKPAEAHYN